jgi:hypothetical protein
LLGAAETQLQIRMIMRLISIIFLALPVLVRTSAVSQRVRDDRGSTLPDAPSAQIYPTQSSHQPQAQFIILLQRRSYCFPDLATKTAPLSARQKFTLFLNDSISGQAIVGSAASAGVEQGFNWLAGYGQGAKGYGKRFGASLARSASDSFFGTFLFATMLRQDPRFFIPRSPTFWHAAKYSLLRVVITRSDSGAATVNSSGLLGPLAGEGLANIYLPIEDRTLGNTFVRYATDLGWRAGENVLRAYWPGITEHVLHRR